MDQELFQFALLFGVLGIAAVTSIWLRFPVVPLYIIAGVCIGFGLEPNEVVRFLGSLGVVFLLFAMGLDFSLRSVAQTPHRFLAAGAIDWVFCFPIGFVAGWALGWSVLESLFLAGILYMSSSAVVSKCIVDFGRAAQPETETILNVMIFEDLAIAVYLVVLNTLTAGSHVDATAWTYAVTLAKALSFVLFLVVFARRFAQPLARVLAARSDEGFTLLLFAFVLLVASAAIAVGLSEAVGAFLAGLVIGATDLKERASTTLHPFGTLFAALFFVSFGMGIDVGEIAHVALPAAALVVIGFATKVAGGYFVGRTSGHTPLQSTVVGFSLVPKGEFSILIAAMASQLGNNSSIEALTAVYVLALCFLGPVAMREAERIFRLFNPRPEPAP